MTEIPQSTTVKELVQRFLDARKEHGDFIVRMDYDVKTDEVLPFGIKVTVGFDEDEMDERYREECE